MQDYAFTFTLAELVDDEDAIDEFYGRTHDVTMVGLTEGDVTRREDLLPALAGVEAVFHFAAYQDYLPDFSRFFRVVVPIGSPCGCVISRVRRRERRSAFYSSPSRPHDESKLS